MKTSIYPCLWFNNNTREAAGLYCQVFGEGRILGDNEFAVNLELSGQRFLLLNGGNQFSFNPSISFYTVFNNEKEVNEAWAKLIEGGSAIMPIDSYAWSERYGMLQDRYGLVWQLTAGSITQTGQKFTPALMFTGANNGRAEESIGLYTSLLPDSSPVFTDRYGKDDNDVAGNIRHAQFNLAGKRFIAMDSSIDREFSFNEAISFVIECDNQEEIDFFWYKLSSGGAEGRCGWLKDRFGVSWQVIPAILSKLMSDPVKSQLVVEAFLKMNKFDISKLLSV
jgi:predicted 3-demethylubiquinone-9 3-methyltransferase (glyoxalase superfamily)